MSDSDRPVSLARLDTAAADRIISELGPGDGERVLRCLRTAESFLRSAGDDPDLRYSESAAYNLREALDSVVRDRPVGDGGLPALIEAWRHYKVARALAGADEVEARAELDAVLDGLEADEQRNGFMTRRLLAWFRQQTGVEPIAAGDDPIGQYQRLRKRAVQVLHREGTPAPVVELYGETVAWFERYFTPPSETAAKLVALAGRPYAPELLTELRPLVMNGHHVRLVLANLDDPAWLDALRDEGYIGLPAPGEVWPVAALVESSVTREAVGSLLQQLLGEVKQKPKSERAMYAFEIQRVASRLGPAGYPIVFEVLKRHREHEWVRMFAVEAAKQIDVTDPVHVEVAIAVVGAERRHDGHETNAALDRLVAGMTEENVGQRFRMLAGKVRGLARNGRADLLLADTAPLPSDGADPSDTLSIAAQTLASIIPRARSLGLPGPAMFAEAQSIPGELGARLVCQILAGAADLDRDIKVAHLAARLSSNRATGDDQALLDDLTPLDDTEILRLRQALGTPSPQPGDDELATFGENWPRVWRWSMLLPAPVLEGWQRQIDAVTQQHGPPDPSLLLIRSPRWTAQWESSPHSVEEIAELETLEAAALVSAWRPRDNNEWGVSARELARTLEAVVARDPQAWTTDPVAVVRALREPIYVDHYLRAVAANASAVGARAAALLEAANLVRHERWDPAVIGTGAFDFEADWSVVETVIVDLIRALADADADLNAELSGCWELTTEMAAPPDDPGSIDDSADESRFDDTLTRAINRPHGRALQAVLALGGWEHRNLGSASDNLADALTHALDVEGGAGLDLCAIIAACRPYVEAIAGEWLDGHRDSLFGGPLGATNIDLTVRWSAPTRSFLAWALDPLLAAARRGTKGAAAWLIIGFLWEAPGYTFDRILDGLASSEGPVHELCRQVGHVLRDADQDQADVIERGLALSERLLDEAGKRVPAAALGGLGTWVLVTSLAPARWLDLVGRTVVATDGQVDLITSVAERCRDAQPSSAGLRVLLGLLGSGAQWDQSYVEELSVDALRRASADGLRDEDFQQLQERLIQRGRHDASL